MAKGRRPGAKNKPGHGAGGARNGSGRKRKTPDSEDEQDEINSTDAPRKRKRLECERETSTQSKGQKECESIFFFMHFSLTEVSASDRAESGSGKKLGPSRVQTSAARSLYPMFRESLTLSPELF
jgi:hypothetical protein